MTSSMGSGSMQISNQTPVNLTGGPLSYRYRFHEIHIHYGLHDQFGSEHSVEGYTFPAEVNIPCNTLQSVSRRTKAENK
jgi:Eukaryotic-type carbonic anhydrase